MPAKLPLPQGTAERVENVPLAQRHPGLQLDKFIQPCPPQEDQKKALDAVCAAGQEDKGLLPNLLLRRQRWLGDQDLPPWRCTTTGPLTLHLARASALENAGICLHPLYGFVYLPGTGLKGMARAYAETVWLPAQKDQATAWRTIEAVFGWAPNSDRRKDWKPEDVPPHDPDDSAAAGAVVFHDAWPEKWPRLRLDIVNNHHRDYYGAAPDDNEHAPGDWETPSMVYFLAVGPGETFVFAVSARRRGADRQLVEQAREWLTGALTHEGAGAKTAAGYGRFKPAGGPAPVLASPARVAFTATLELVTPAFLAGARQQPEDCELRPATLRGLLRWWWRTLHAGFVDAATLRRLEATIWGDTNSGGAVRITVEPDTTAPRRVGPCPFRKMGTNKRGQAILVPDEGFRKQQGIQPGPPRTTQPLFYVSYGMDEMKTGDPESRRQRSCMWPGARWKVRLTARHSCYEEKDRAGQMIRREPIPAGQVLAEAKAALWLLCHLGGVGSKARKGYGSFADPAELAGATLEGCQQDAAKLRSRCQVGQVPSGTNPGESPSLRHLVLPPAPSSDGRAWLEVTTAWRNPWFALDQVGAAAQAFAQAEAATGHGKHCADKAALGLPRKIHGPLASKLPHQRSWTPPLELTGPKGDRYASPILYHIGRDDKGNLLVRVTAFLADLPNPATSRRVLTELLTHLQNDLQERSRTGGEERRALPGSSAPAGRSSAREGVDRTSGRRAPGTPATVKILAPHEKGPKGSFFVQEEGKPKGMLSLGKPPESLPAVGDSVQVYINSDDPRSPQYRWDKPPRHEEPRRGGRGSPPPRGRR